MMKQKNSKWPALLKYLLAVPTIFLLAILFQSQAMPELTPVAKYNSELELKESYSRQELSKEIEKLHGHVNHHKPVKFQVLLNAFINKYPAHETDILEVFFDVAKHFEMILSKVDIGTEYERWVFAVRKNNFSEIEKIDKDEKVIDKDSGSNLQLRNDTGNDKINFNGNLTTPNSKCKPGENGVHFYVDKRPTFPSCFEIEDEDEREKCTYANLKEFWAENFKNTKDGLARGFEGSLRWMLTFDEEGNIIEAKIPGNFKPYKYGYQEEGERLIEKLKAEYSFTPAVCQGNKVKSWLSIGIPVRLSDEEKKNVIPRNSKTVERVNQNLQLSNASSEGSLSISYESNMNAPLSLEILNPKGKSVYKKEWDYMYKRKGDWFQLDNPINGKYTAIAIQDGQEKRTSMDIKVYE